MRGIVKLAIVATSMAGALAFAASPATAQDAANTQGQHCVANTANGKFACADTEQQARQLADVGAQDVNAVRLYDRKNFDDADGTLTLTAPRACTSGYEDEFRYSNLGPENDGSWSDRASSVRTYNSCDVKLHDSTVPPEDISEGSTWIDEAADLSEIGNGWNNRASSARAS